MLKFTIIIIFIIIIITVWRCKRENGTTLSVFKSRVLESSRNLPHLGRFSTIVALPAHVPNVTMAL